MPAFGNALVVNQVIPETGGVFSGNAQSIDFDPDGDGDFEQGGLITYEDGITQATDIDASQNVALITATVTFADGQQITYQNLVAYTLNDGNTLIYAFDAGAAGASSPEPITHSLPVSIDIQPFEYNYDYFQDIADEILDLGGDDDPPCFAKGTMIETANGPMSVEDLQIGTLVKTKDNGLQPVKWTGRIRLGRKQLLLKPKLQPIRIGSGAIGNTRELILSPTHRVLIKGWRAQMLFDSSEVLVAACDLVNDDSIQKFLPENGVTYHHFMLAGHEIIYSEGAETESLHPNLAMLGEKSRHEILQLFPELETTEPGPTARFLGSARIARLLMNN